VGVGGDWCFMSFWQLPVFAIDFPDHLEPNEWMSWPVPCLSVTARVPRGAAAPDSIDLLTHSTGWAGWRKVYVGMCSRTLCLPHGHDFCLSSQIPQGWMIWLQKGKKSYHVFVSINLLNQPIFKKLKCCSRDKMSRCSKVGCFKGTGRTDTWWDLYVLWKSIVSYLWLSDNHLYLM